MTERRPTGRRSDPVADGGDSRDREGPGSEESGDVAGASSHPGERLAQNADHDHENQTEFIYVAADRCRVDVEDGPFDCGRNETVYFEAGAAHLLYNPFEEPCTILATGEHPEGRYPVESIKFHENLLAERYGSDPAGRSE